MTEKEMLLDYLQNVGPLTSAQWFYEAGSLKLTTRVSELRSEGYTIFQRRIKKPNRWGQMRRFNEYSMGRAI